MAHSFRYLILAAVFCASFLAGHTETVPERAPLVFTVFARHRQSGLQFLPDDKSPPQALEFFGNTRSPVYTCRGGARLPFFEAVQLTAYWDARTRDPKKPPPLPKAVATAEIPADLERGLLLFIPLDTPAPDGSRFRIFVVDDSPRRLPAGYAAVINASGREYRAKMDSHTFDVPHGIGGKVPVKGTVELRLATQSDEGWVGGGHHTFRLGERDRVSLVFFPPTSPTGIAPIIRTLIDEVPDGPSSDRTNTHR